MLVNEFAQLINRTPAAVTERLRVGKPYDCIKDFRKFGNTYDLDVDAEKLALLIVKNSKPADHADA